MADNKIIIGKFVLGIEYTNVYVLHREGSAEAVLVDPAARGDALADAIQEQGLHVDAVLLTHAHFDHIGGVKEFTERTDAKVYISEKETRLIRDPEANLSSVYETPRTVQPDVFLRDGEEVTLAGMTFRCLATPGHTEGSCCYYIQDTGDAPILLAGDTLFEESVGRADFPTGSMSALIRSIRDKLLPLPEETRVYPGHGGMTTIGHEKKFNPML